MKKILFALLVTFSVTSAFGQFAEIDAMLSRLEQKRGLNKELRNENLEDKKFLLIKDFNDHTERMFLVLKGKNATFVEIFDDKATGKSTSNVFSGDVIRTRKNVLSFRFDKLEGKKIQVPIAKTLLLTKQKEVLYLKDLNSQDRWIDQAAAGK